MWDIDIFRYAVCLLILVLLLIVLRRAIAVRNSGGDFFAGYKISKGKLYIHNALYFRKRTIPLKEIKRIDVKYISGKVGDRYMLIVERRKGSATAFMFGKTEKNDRLVENLSRDTRSHSIKISK